MPSAEQYQHGDSEADKAGCFGERKAEKQRPALAGGGGRIAQRAREEVPEYVANADACAAERDRRYAGANHLCCFNFHLRSPSRVGLNGSVIDVQSVIEIETGEQREYIGLKAGDQKL
jgi:hypothetical protein